MPFTAEQKRERRLAARYKTLTCQHCNEAFSAARRDARYCPQCKDRYVSDLHYPMVMRKFWRFVRRARLSLLSLYRLERYQLECKTWDAHRQIMELNGLGTGCHHPRGGLESPARLCLRAPYRSVFLISFRLPNHGRALDPTLRVSKRWRHTHTPPPVKSTRTSNRSGGIAIGIIPAHIQVFSNLGGNNRGEYDTREQPDTLSFWFPTKAAIIALADTLSARQQEKFHANLLGLAQRRAEKNDLKTAHFLYELAGCEAPLEEPKKQKPKLVWTNDTK